MRYAIRVAAVAGLVGSVLVPSIAAAASLISPPIKGGAGGLICACTNLTSEPIEVRFRLAFVNGTLFCNDQNISPAFLKTCSVASQEVRTCDVTRTDGKALSPKQLACTFSSFDGNGNPTITVPVDRKLK